MRKLLSLFSLLGAVCGQESHPMLDNRLYSSWTAQSLSNAFLSKPRPKKEIFKEFFRDSSLKPYYSFDINSNGLMEEIYGESHNVKFANSDKKHPLTFNFRKFIHLEIISNDIARTLLVADEDRILNSTGEISFQYDPNVEWRRTNALLRWWFVATYFGQGNGDIGVKMKWTENYEIARQSGGGGSLNSGFIYHWNKTNQAYELDMERSRGWH